MPTVTIPVITKSLPVTTAKDPDAWEAFKARYLDVSEAEYQEAVKSR